MVLLSGQLDELQDALKVREGEVSDLCQRMEKLSAAGQATAEDIGRLKENLGREVAARLGQEVEEVAQLRGELEKKGSEMQ